MAVLWSKLITTSSGGRIGCHMDLWEREDAADMYTLQSKVKPIMACFSHCFVPANKFQVPILPYLKLGIFLDIMSSAGAPPVVGRARIDLPRRLPKVAASDPESATTCADGGRRSALRWRD
ncbi:hypothetical protein OPV22_006818 [Ensete ventricosum]|uniref:Uncharacterized protein n=1 Tax=Ensete ventricosum TaxID=4639 RepID=A0AAV8Q5B4_ENSVE|nr:hypothetical protein OPV22_006818 [Ensete ventricosum]